MREQELLALAKRRFNVNEVGIFTAFYGRHEANVERNRYLRTGYLEDDFIVFLCLKLRKDTHQRPAR